MISTKRQKHCFMEKKMTQRIKTYTWQDVENAVRNIAMQMYKDNWRPDYIVGITRGGLVPAVLLSHMTGIPMHTLCVQLANEDLEENTESNCWMAEDAFGYVSEEERSIPQIYSDADRKKNILIIDDINRGGDAMKWIKQDWQGGCLPDNPNWDTVWHGNVKFAALLDNVNSKVSMDYCDEEFAEGTDDLWIEFPWEA
jgi:hypoxanthine phosphoribosyltransferase